jgi:hypothetical protein
MVVTPGSRIISADAYDDLLKEKCGYLEEQHEEEFFAFMNQQFGAQAVRAHAAN